MKTLPEQARITASMIALGERIAHGRDVDLLIQLATIVEAQEDVITRLQYEVDAIPAIKAERDALAACYDAREEEAHQLSERIIKLTVERDMLRYEVDAIPAIKAERDEYAKAADSMAMAHKVERDALMSAGKLAMDALVHDTRDRSSARDLGKAMSNTNERAELIHWLRERSMWDGMIRLIDAANMLEADAQAIDRTLKMYEKAHQGRADFRQAFREARKAQQVAVPDGYALAMAVLQSSLYQFLDDVERAECDALIAAAQGAKP